MIDQTIPHMTIGGEAIAGEQSYDVLNPATGEVFAAAPVCSRDQLDRAFAAAASVLPSWRANDDARRALMLELADAVSAAGEELLSLLIAESGKPRELAAIELTGADLWLRYLAGVDLPRKLLADDEAARIELVRRPVGVVAAIIPWNFPIAQTIVKVAPALRVGATVVVKPSPYAPLTALRLGELLNEVLPAGVVNVVSGGDELGEWMTSHPVPRKVTFTGSIEAGKHVAASAGADVKRVTLELGGNDAAILLDDVDIESAVPALFARAFFATGQACALPKRIYVPEHLYDGVVDAFAAVALGVSLGAGDDGEMGPLSTKPQYERVGGLVADALADGCVAVTGGAPVEGPGFFYPPTIIAGAREGMRIVDEEQFGPACPILSYRDLDEAVRRANDTMFGLCGSVWGEDLERATEVAEQLECGVTYVNAHGVHRPTMPMIGCKWSGLGVENGYEGMLEFTQPQVVYRATSATDTALT